MDFNNEINCYTCKYGYFNGFSCDGYHNFCGVEKCYLCAQQCEYCGDYEKGDVPKGKKRDL